MFNLLILLVMSFGVFAQDQMAVRINEKGILKVMLMALKYNTNSRNARTFAIPADIYKFSVPRADLLSNPVVQILSEVSDVDLNRDLDFYLHTDSIRVTGTVNPESLKTQITNSSPNGFDLNLSIAIPSVSAAGPSLSLCEDKMRGVKKCGSGLKATVADLRLSTSGKPVMLSMTLRLRIDNGVARVKVLRMSSNVESQKGPVLDIDFGSVTVPPITLIVDGVETQLDTSGIRTEILKRKTFLAKKLMTFLADFIASDMAEMINVYLVHRSVVTSWEVYRRDNPITFDEFLVHHRAENTYRRRPLPPEAADAPGASIEALFAEIIRKAQVKVSLDKISTPMNKDIEIYSQLGLMLNNRIMSVRNTLGNSGRALPPLNLSGQRASDVNLVFSEPLINGALDLVGSTGLFQELFDRVAGVAGVSIKNVKLHFTSRSTVVAVANSQVDLKELQSSSIAEWLKNLIAAWLERNNNKAVIYFPIELEIVPTLVRTAAGGVNLSMLVKSPFDEDGLMNEFNYASNVDRMNDTVRAGVIKNLRENLSKHVNKSYSLDVSRFMNQSGVVFKPNYIGVNQGAYLMLNLDIADIKFHSMNPGLR